MSVSREVTADSNESITNSETDSSCSDISTYYDFDTLIVQLEEIYEEHVGAIQVLERLQYQIANTKNVYLLIDGNKCDFHKVLEELHVQCLEKIRNGEMVRFGEELLQSLPSLRLSD